MHQSPPLSTGAHALPDSNPGPLLTCSPSPGAGRSLDAPSRQIVRHQSPPLSTGAHSLLDSSLVNPNDPPQLPRHPTPKDPPQLPRHPTDFSLRLPQGWRQNIAEGDRQWIGRALFVAKGVLTSKLKLWFYPPPHELPASQPNPDNYHLRRLFLWAPRRMWKVDFLCPNCKESLRSKGLYNHIRLVLDVKDMYYMAGEYMDCKFCHATFVSWDNRMIAQLADGVRAYFPVTLTRKYACDQSVVTLLRARTLGNSPTALCHNLQELHSEEWLRKQLCYLTDCKRHREGPFQQPATYKDPLSFPSFPIPRWFLAVYVRDVWSRLDTLLAEATSIYGKVLKIDSSKKLTKKLQGADSNTANWVTNVGNERGEILISVLTTSEGIPALQPLANGLVERYKAANMDPPMLLYTDRDCCSQQGSSKFQVLFCHWQGLIVRLDIWHFMRRLAKGCTSESHPLYGTFMSKLSQCIFEWDSGDYSLLMSAKRSEMTLAGLVNPSDSAITHAISKDELSKHCRRRTRGTKKTIELIEALLLGLSQATDTLGAPLFKEEITTIWSEEQRHVECIQDPPGMELYTTIGQLKKGRVSLPLLRCARGSTSLESFHLHLTRFVPGSSANAVNLQAYLLDGVTRWNADRAAASIDSDTLTLRTFDGHLKTKVSFTFAIKYHDQQMHFSSRFFLFITCTCRLTSSAKISAGRRSSPTINHQLHTRENCLGWSTSTGSQASVYLPAAMRS